MLLTNLAASKEIGKNVKTWMEREEFVASSRSRLTEGKEGDLSCKFSRCYSCLLRKPAFAQIPSLTLRYVVPGSR